MIKMSSGIFFIGRDALSLRELSEYIEPVLNERGYAVTDRAQINDAGNDGKLVLIALSGEGDLETGLKQALEEAGRRNDETNSRKKEYEESIPGSHFINNYIPIAVYSETSAASDSFKGVHQDYLSRRALVASQRAIDNLTEYETRAKSLEKKLEKLATTSLSEMG
jgi:hypothetical protein